VRRAVEDAQTRAHAARTPRAALAELLQPHSDITAAVQVSGRAAGVLPLGAARRSVAVGTGVERAATAAGLEEAAPARADGVLAARRGATSRESESAAGPCEASRGLAMSCSHAGPTSAGSSALRAPSRFLATLLLAVEARATQLY
jgi:hypothetical protein